MAVTGKKLTELAAEGKTSASPNYTFGEAGGISVAAYGPAHDGFGFMPPSLPTAGHAITNNYAGSGEVDFWSLVNNDDVNLQGFYFWQKNDAITAKSIGAFYSSGPGANWSELDVMVSGLDNNFFSIYVDPDQVGLGANNTPINFYGQTSNIPLSISATGIISALSDNVGEIPPSSPAGFAITNNYFGYGEVDFWNLVNSDADAQGWYFIQKTDNSTGFNAAALYVTATATRFDLYSRGDKTLGLYINDDTNTTIMSSDTGNLALASAVVSMPANGVGIIPASQAAAGAAITNNYAGAGEVDFWNLVNNEDTNNEGFYFHQKTAAGTEKLLSSIYSSSAKTKLDIKFGSALVGLTITATEASLGANAVPLNFYVGPTGSLLAASFSTTGLLRFFGTTSAFPALKRSAGRLQARLADDTSFTGLDANTLSLFGAFGQAANILQLTELLTIAAAATSSTAIQIPARSLVLGVTVRVTAAIPTAATFTVGVTGAAARYGTAIPVALNTIFDSPPTDSVIYYAAATSILITPNLTPGTNVGRVRVQIHYVTFTPPTS